MEDTLYTAKTRGGQMAWFKRVPPGHEVLNGYNRPPFVLLGYIRKDEPEVWTAQGAWLETGEPHPHDLM